MMSETQYQNQYPPAPPPGAGAPATVIYVTTTNAAAPAPMPPQQQVTRWQNNATAAGSIIMLSAGMNLALNVGWSGGSFFAASYSWFIGVIAGTILSAVMQIFMAKKIILTASILLILIDGILFTSLPYNGDAMLAARYLNGIAIGLTVVPFLKNTSEIAVSVNRGSCLALEQFSVSLGIAIQMAYASYWGSSWELSANCLHGIFDIVYAVLGGAFVILFVESPIDQLCKGNEQGALDSLVSLRRPRVITANTTTLLERLKGYVRKQENLTVGESLSQGLLPLAKMLLFRSLLLAFCMSMPLTFAFEYAVLVNNSSWPVDVAAAARILGSVMAICMIDKVNRKVSSLIAVFIIGLLLIIIGSLSLSFADLLSYSDMTALSIMYIFLQFTAGFFAPYTSACLGEAFPLRVKPYLMDVCVIVEQLIQIILIAVSSGNRGVGLLVQGIIAVVVCLLLCLTMPETRNTTLTEAQKRFRVAIYRKMT